MDRCQCRPELSERFGSCWSIWVGEIRMDQSFGTLFSGGNKVWTNGPESLSEVSPWDWHRSMDGSSQPVETVSRNCRFVSLVVVECILTRSNRLKDTKNNNMIFILGPVLEGTCEGGQQIPWVNTCIHRYSLLTFSSLVSQDCWLLLIISAPRSL